MCGRGVCVAGGVCDTHVPLPGRYYGYGIRSMSGRYASYWNAFLLEIHLETVLGLKHFRLIQQKAKAKVSFVRSSFLLFGDS